MQQQFLRTQLLFGEQALETLRSSHVAIFGIGGVGGYTAEVLARSGVGKLDLFDNDRISTTNINRQVYALLSTVGRYKVDVAEERIHDINEECVIEKHTLFYLPSNAASVDLSVYDYVVDCIDTITSKIELVKRCDEHHIPIISCMGAANKIDATAFRVADIYKTKMDPIAKVVRKKLREYNIKQLKVVYSEEQPMVPVGKALIETDTPCPKRITPASNAFVPAAAGIIIGGEVVKDLMSKGCKKAEDIVG